MAYGGALYAGGWYTDPDSNTPLWRIEKRSESTGNLVTDFGTSGAAISNVVGEVMAFGANGDNFFAAGTDFAPGLDAEWRIEKRNLNSGGLISTFGINGVITENLSAGDDTITDIVLNADNNSLYVVGYDFTAGVNPEIRIERRDMDTGGLCPG